MNEKRFFRSRNGFTLLELLTVILVVVLLVSILLPSLRAARQKARKTACLSNLRQIGLAVQAYAHDYNDTIPFGPEGLPIMGHNFYTATGNVTSLLSLLDGRPVGLGLLLDTYLSEQPKVLFCPGADQPSEAERQLANVGHRQAQSDYFYRHASVALLSGTPDTFHIRLSNLGKNRSGRRIRALAMDVQFRAHPSLEAFGVFTRTSHLRKIVNLLFADGTVRTADNTNDRFTIDVAARPYDALEEILKRFELADELESSGL
jgi:prepilin-type N-terminal cleavage/methylation domain-containing protein